MQLLSCFSYVIYVHVMFSVFQVVRCLKGLCKPFNEYPFSVQKEIVQKAFYDK